LEEELSLASFWELSFNKKSKLSVGFSTFRAFIFKDLLDELNAILEEHSDKLSSYRGRPVLVQFNEELDLTESYSKQSGGERKRSDLVILLSLFELIRNGSRYSPSYIILDEIFDSLDTNGKPSVQNLISSIAKNLRKVIIVTHMAELMTGVSIAGRIIVKMKVENGKANGSEIEICPT